MAELTLSYATSTSSTGISGRAIVSARNHHIVTGNTGGEDLGSGELFLGGIGACAVGMVGGIATRESVPLQWMDVAVEAYRDRDKPPGELALFDRVTVHFQTWGVSDDQAQQLVDEWKRR